VFDTKIPGIISLILGILVILFPVFSVFTLSVLTGVAVLFVAVWLFLLGAGTWKVSRGAGALYILLGVLGVIVAAALAGNVVLFSFLTAFWIYITGIILIIAGITALFSREHRAGRAAGISVVVLGIIYIILGILVTNPVFLAWLIGLSLIIDGIGLLMY
jgi:uncharacterized membrane protein HdeD (DUF308 family)